MILWRLAGLLAAAAGGFAVTGAAAGLADAAQYVFDALVAFTCWAFSWLLDIILFAVVTSVENLPGGFIETSTLLTITNAAGFVTDWFPVEGMLKSGGAYLGFLLVWVVVRTVLRLSPGIA